MTSQAVAPEMPLPAKDAPGLQICCYYVSRTKAMGLLGELRAVLTPAERERERCFHFERDRDRYAVTRALLRRLLSQQVALAPEAIEFEYNDFGRPRIADAQNGSNLDFNISHTADVVVIAIGRQRALGVDVECLQRDAPFEIVGRVFAQPESEHLGALDPAARKERFWELWTLKEAYVKGRGLGLTLPLGSFSFALPGNDRITFTPPSQDEADDWQFWQFRIWPDYIGSLCCRRLDGSDTELVFHNPLMTAGLCPQILRYGRMR